MNSSSRSLVVVRPIDVSFFYCLCILVNAIFVFAKNHGSDMGFWVNWATQLQASGYSNFDGNYPPVYVHWLFVCGLLSELGLFELSNNYAFKAVALVPVFCAHVSLIRLVDILCKRFEVAENSRNFTQLLVVFNPAFLMDGPVWGQVDLFPTVICMWGLYFSIGKRWTSILAMPVFMLAVLTKFQMVFIAPIAAAIFLSRYGLHSVGMFFSALVFVVVYFPFILEGNFFKAFKLAYIETLGQYPVTTLNASNLMMLITGNEAPDGLTLLNGSSDLLAKLFSFKVMGMIAYACLCVFLMCSFLSKLYSRRAVNPKCYFEYALISAMIFFAVLPGMHERYLVPAVVVAVLAGVFSVRLLWVAGLLSVSSALNIAMILPLGGELLWKPFSLFFCLICVFALMAVFAENLMSLFRVRFVSFVNCFLRRFFIFPAEIFMMALVLSAVYFYNVLNKQPVSQSNLMRDYNGVYLSDLQVEVKKQGWGNLGVNRAANGAGIKVGAEVYEKGFGVHAHSEISVSLEAQQYRFFSFMYSLDDYSRGGFVRFIVQGDGEELWKSPRVSTGSALEVVTLPIEGVKKLTLVVESLGSINGDHANWVSPLLHN
jgi:hypothetical protein